MSPGVRKLALTFHLVVSVGWIGAVIAYLALDVFAVTSPDIETARASSIAMGLVGLWAIIPLAFASLLTGLVMALGTAWGLFRHYWVLISFVLTTLSIVVLVSHLVDLRGAVEPTAHMNMSGAHESRGPSGDFLHAGGGLLVLLVITTLNVYKPRGLTPYGWRRRRESRP